MRKLEQSVEKLVEELKAKEAAQDQMLRVSREVVRHCSVAIKYIHEGKMAEAQSQLDAARKQLDTVRKQEESFRNLASHVYQEYAEAMVLKDTIERKPLPGYEDIGVPWMAYLLGLLDCIGELRRELLEALRKGRKADAEYYFTTMEKIYETLLPLKFSSSLLPGFRVKQDVARRQVEQARSELVTSR